MKQKYWLADNGVVRCLDDRCPQECNMECPIYLNTIALECLQHDDAKEAAQYLEKAVAIEPIFGEAWNNLAACYGQLGRHQDAFEAYLKSYNLNPKSHAVFGMAVAMKNLGNYSQAMQYTSLYVHKYGEDERINSLIAEIAEKKLEAVVKPKVSAANTYSDLDDMHLFGSIYLTLLNPSMREKGYAELEKMESRFPEAAITLGQYYQGIDREKAKKHFKIAADAGIAEGQWGYSQMLPHGYVLDFSATKDKEYLKYCLAAAEGGSPDAANEIGNICHRKGFYEESTYWYGMAYSLEHPQGMVGLRGITKEWAQQGIVKEFVPHLEGVSEDRHKTSLLLYKMFNQSLDVKDMDELMTLALAGENLAGFILAKIMEQGNHDDMAYTIYNALAFENHPYALRCYADMILAGKGTARNIEKAFNMYEESARGGNATAMFAMGQKAAKVGDKYLAASWFGMAYDRGMDLAGEWLSGLAK